MALDFIRIFASRRTWIKALANSVASMPGAEVRLPLIPIPSHSTRVAQS